MTGVADEFSLEHTEVVEGLAEHAGSFETPDYHGVTSDGHVEKVAVLDPEYFAVFRRNDDSAEVIDASGNPACPLVGRV